MFPISGLSSCVLAALVLTSACVGGGGGDAEETEPVGSSPPVDGPTTTAGDAAGTTDNDVTTTNGSVAYGDNPQLDPAGWENEVDEIVGRYLLMWSGLNEAYGPPTADPIVPLAEEIGSEEFYAGVQQELAGYQDLGQVFLIADDSLEDHILLLPDWMPDEKSEGAVVTMQDCWIQDNTLQTEDGQVVETFFQAELLDVEMEVMFGEWRVVSNDSAAADSSGWAECNSHFEKLQP